MCGLVKTTIISPIKVIQVIVNKLADSLHVKYIIQSHMQKYIPYATFGPCAVHA